MGFIGRDPSNALQLGESNTTATDACNTDRRLTGTLVEEGSRLMPQSKPFPSFTLSPSVTRALKSRAELCLCVAFGVLGPQPRRYETHSAYAPSVEV